MLIQRVHFPLGGALAPDNVLSSRWHTPDHVHRATLPQLTKNKDNLQQKVVLTFCKTMTITFRLYFHRPGGGGLALEMILLHHKVCYVLII